MTGMKTNERPGTKAQVRYLRMSPSKARVVLDLIRDKSVAEAIQILAFSERLAAKEIDKVLRSAVANAQHNDQIPAEELFVSACFADEGPTLKRFRPRARGRAGRINKRTCHITVIVSRMDDDLLDRLREKAAGRGAATPSADRQARVAKSRGEEVVAEEAEIVSDDVADDAAVVDDAVVEEAVVEEASVEDGAPEGSHALIDGDPENMPDGFPIKGNSQSKLYHNEASSFYGRTKAEIWFASDEAAEAAGFSKPESQQKKEAAAAEAAVEETAAEETAADDSEAGDA